MPQNGVAFQAGGRVLLVTCPAHAHLVQQGAQLVKRVAVQGLREFMQDKTPNLFDVLQEVWEEREKLREQNE
jgi:hypothetical protein